MVTVHRFVGLSICALSVAVASGQSFQNPRAIHVDGPGPLVSVADMNNDGAPDLIVQTADTTTPSAIQILLANAARNFTGTTQKVTSSSLFSYPCVPADVNGDKKIDLVCASSTPAHRNSNVIVYLGNGDGTLQNPISTSLDPIWTSGATPDIVAVADVNNDGHPDVVVTDGPLAGWGYSNLTLLGDGSGHFTLKPFQGGLGWGPATVTDVNGDHIPDLLSMTGPDIFLGNGDGTFALQAQYQYSFGNCIFADFEKTGRLSAACKTLSGDLQIFHMNDDGTLSTRSPIGSVSFAGRTPLLSPLRAIDLNGDSILDMAIISKSGLEVMLGTSQLQFSDPVLYAAGTTVWQGTTTGFFTDMDGDGHPDYIGTGPGSVYISYGNANGSLGAPVLSQSGTSIYLATTADFDGDGLSDVVTVGAPSINFIHGKGDGTFAPPMAVTLPAGYSLPSSPQSSGDLLLGDFNGDGKKDFLLSVGLFSDNSLFLGNGDGTFAVSFIPAQTLPRTGGSVVADVNGDGKDDIVQMSQTAINVYLSQSPGTFVLVPSTFPNGANQSTTIGFGKLNGDRTLDAIISFPDHAIVLTGNGDGSFTSTATTLTIPAVNGINLITNITPALTVGDFDGDTRPDVALLGEYTNYTPDLYFGGTTVRYSSAIWVYYGNGDTTFSQPVSAGIFYDKPSFNITAAAVSSSGSSDLIIADLNPDSSPVASSLALIPSVSGRTFGEPRYFLAGDGINSVQVADFNRDGKLDLFASPWAWYPTSQGPNTFVALLNQQVSVKGALVTAPQPSLAEKPYSITAELVSFQSQLGNITGDMSFTVDGIPISAATLDSNVATQTVSTNLAGGVHQIIATWAGNDTFAPVSVSTVQHIMDYSIKADPNASIQTGHQGTIGVHLASIEGFADTLSLSCGNLPTYATCTFANPTPSLSSGQALDIQISFGTVSSTSAQGRFAKGYLPLSLSIVLPGLLLLSRRRIQPGMLVALAGLALVAVSGCGGNGKGGSSNGGGGGGGTPPTQSSTTPGTYQISVIANGKNTQLQHTASVTVTVTP